MSLGPRITFQSPVVQGINPISPDLMKESRHNVQACRPLRPVLKRAQVLNRGALHCLIEESYLPCSNNPRLLEPFSGFKEHLCHQLLNSPLPCRAALPHVNSHHLLQLEALLPVPQGLGSSLMQRTVELCNPQRRQLPCITMTRPTPSPKHLHNTENRHVAWVHVFPLENYDLFSLPCVSAAPSKSIGTAKPSVMSHKLFNGAHLSFNTYKYPYFWKVPEFDR